MATIPLELEPGWLVSTEPIHAWRAWTLAGTRDGRQVRLRPIAGSTKPWPPMQPARAHCSLPRFHAAPNLDCTCGLHATHEPDLLRKTRGPSVLGTVALWGRVVEHEHGYRAELGYPQRLKLICHLCFWQWGLSGSEPETVARLALGRMVPLCAEHVALSERYGFKLPKRFSAQEVQARLLGTYAVDLLYV